MRTREEIKKDLETAFARAEDRDYWLKRQWQVQDITLEVLLDIREQNDWLLRSIDLISGIQR